MSQRTIVFQRKALEDIEEIVSFIAQDSTKAAKNFRDTLEQTCVLLAEMPDMGMARDFKNPTLTNIRLWPLKRFEKYLIFYRVQGNTLNIIRVVHGVRDLPTLFGETSENGA